MENDNLMATFERLIRMCEANIKIGVKDIEMKITRQYKGEKKIRVMGDLYGVPISYEPNKGIVLVRVNASRMLGKLKNSRKELEKEMGILANGKAIR